MRRDATFVYSLGERAPDPAALGAAVARQGTPAQLAAAIKAEMEGRRGRRRQMLEGGGAHGRGAAPGEVPAAGGAAAAGALGPGEAEAEEDEGWLPAWLRPGARARRLAEEEQAAEEVAAAEAEEAAGDGAAADLQPEPGSYSAAMLAAFDDDAVAAARLAVTALKQEVMQHNVWEVRALLEDTAARRAAWKAALQAEAGGKKGKKGKTKGKKKGGGG